MRARKGCVTASVIGQIYCMRVKTDPHRLVADINQQNVKDLSHVPAIAHGIKFEDAARLFYANKYNVDIESRGFMLHPIHEWLGASTDGFINQTNTAVEIKCPMPVEDKTKLIELIQLRES